MASFLYVEELSDWRTVYLKTMAGLTIFFGVTSLWNEALGKQPATYSKFAEATRIKGKTTSSRTGMLLLYSPSAIAATLVIALKLVVGQSTGEYPTTRFWIVAGAIALHFYKRVLEVLFVHHYSGVMELQTAVIILLHYSITTVNVLFAQHIADPLPPPVTDTIRYGLLLYVLGMSGNFYHHFLLRNLRKDGSKKYVIPQGGLFPVFVAPHYIFEIIEFVGIALLCQTYFSVVQAIHVIFYLSSRSYGTKQWYRKKIGRFPSNRCALIPGVL